MRRHATIDRVDGSAFRVPTDAPESDGTHEWDSTTMVLAEVHAEGSTGIGYSYASAGARQVVENQLAPVVKGRCAMDVPAMRTAMQRAVRNIGSRGVAACAIAAVETALWDLKARLLSVPLIDLLGGARATVTVYGSGGFTSYDDARLQQQLGDWVVAGMRAVKMKVGREPDRDRERVRLARAAIGDDVELMVDANGAYTRAQALRLAESFAEHDVGWFEEPVSSDDLTGLRSIRERAPAGMEITAGEYGYDVVYFQRMLEANAVDVLQVDVTRCQGIMGVQEAATLCLAQQVPLSLHTAPALHLHVACSAAGVRHIEYFHDHARIERMFFDGVVEPVNGVLSPDRSRIGHGLTLRRRDAEPYRVA